MALRVETLQDADVEEYIRIRHAAFRSNPALGHFIQPTADISPDDIASSAAQTRKAMRENPDVRFAKVVDENGTMIATAHWHVYEHERTQEQQEEIQRMAPLPPQANAAAWNDFFGYLSESRRDILGTRPAVLLHILVTHPTHHRRGAGALLLQRALEDADRLGLEAYLEASEAGRNLYARYGFESVFRKEFDLEKYGGSGTDANTVMIRPPRKSGQRI
ncbi:acyl-CoA N-acyltransferase [Trichodelitschia bisporula]|uniref:Acyl-CoA N-acyltransferase n=1 Tax=Trichodelitschia bisporula TaxID=703511 RepID=A0A6G1IB76_9PEZI|nr:acyl-CoA N-acyltransferase [Trichodelitschia bisporula]